MISQSALLAQSQEQVLESAAAHVSRHLQTEEFTLLKDVAVSRPSTTPSVLFVEEDPPQFSRGDLHAKAQIPLRFSSGDMRLLMLGPRRGGRRYLSEDLDDMRRLGAAIVEHIERFRTEELRRLVSQAELRALQAQINPHFLFNALNTLYGTIDRQSQGARQLVLNLAEIFRYVLQGNRALISLGEELRIVQAYLEIEKVRLGDRLEMRVLVPDSLHACLIPVLSLQPLVENAVKHGIIPKRGAGCVSVTAQRVEGGVRIAVTDTGVGFQQSAGKVRSGTGVGIENVRKRLAICYGSRSELRIDSGAEGTSVMFDIPERVVPDLPVTEQELMSVPGPGDIAVRS